MNKNYSLIVSGSSFSLSNNTDADIMSDYSPGIWAIKTQKSTLRFARQILAQGDTIEVTTYNEPRYAALANMFIKELGLKQPLFEEPAPIVSENTGDKPANLSQLKKYLQVGTKIRITNTGYQGERRTRDTVVMKVQTNSITVAKDATLPKDRWQNSWLEFGKASDWQFTKTGATKFYTDRDGRKPSTTIEYIDSCRDCKTTNGMMCRAHEALTS